MDTSLPFGSWLKQRRKALALTQDQLARQAGCSVITVKRLEAGDLLASKQLALLLATALGVPTAQQQAFIHFVRTPTVQASPTEFTEGAHSTPAEPDLVVPEPAYSSLPAPLTGVIGREREVAAACHLLRKPAVRLLTLIGPPGTGKTRLSLQIAAQLAPEYKDRVCWVPLAPINEPALIISAIAQALGLREMPEQALLSTLQTWLYPKQLLLVLDNFEQVVAGADLIAQVLQAAPQVNALTTSREALHIYGEQYFPVPPLEVPNLQQLPPVEAVGLYPAVELFVERVQAAQPAFTLDEHNVAAVAGICAWLDGLPLAIEMAAARTRWSTPATVLQQLSQRLQVLTGGPRDLTPRQQTLRGAIDWSYDLLPVAEQQLFRWLAVFVDGCTIEAIMTVCGATEFAAGAQWSADGVRPMAESPQSMASLTATLHALVEKSLVRQAWPRTLGEPTEARFGMLLTIQEYAWEKLRTADEATAFQRRHAEYYVALAEQAEPELTGKSQALWLDWLAAEHSNLRAALDWSESVPEGAELGLRLVGALHMYWQVRGHFREGCARLASALERTATWRTPARAKALFVMGMLGLFQGEYAHAGQCFAEGLAIRREGGDQWGISLMLNGLGRVAEYQGRFPDALRHYEEALALRRALDHQWGIGGCLNNLGRATLRQGDHRRAKPLFEEGLAIFRSTGDTSTIAMVLCNLTLVALREQNYAQAARFIKESFELQLAIGYKWGIPYLLAYTAEIVCSRGRTTDDTLRAIRLLGAVETMLQAIGTRMDPFDRADYERCLAGAQAEVAPDMFQATLASGRALASDEAVDSALRELQAFHPQP